MKRFKLLEAKSIEAEYNSNWSAIPRDVFDEIILLDPQTNIEKQTVGPNAKQLLLPKYISGETNFLDNKEAVKDAIDKFIKNRSAYEIKNIALYPSVEAFAKYIEDPENNSINAEEVKEESKIDKIYNQYYKDINKEDFLYIISIDPETNIEKGSIGKYAKNFLLRLYKNGVNEIVNKDFKDKIIASINYIEENKNTLDKKWQSLNTLTDFGEFIKLPNFIEDSDLLKYLKNSIYWKDIEYIGSTQKHDIFVPKNYLAAAAIAGADDSLHIPGTSLKGPGIDPETGSKAWSSNLYAHWCTTSKSYWTTYNKEGQKYYNFMARGSALYSNERRNNYQLAIKPDGSITDKGVADGYEDYNHPAVVRLRLFAEDPDIIDILAKEDGYAGNMAEVRLIKLVNECNKTFIYKGKEDYDKFFNKWVETDQKIIKGLFTKLIIDVNVKEIHSSAFVNWGLKEISFNEGLEVIGVDAFRNCGNLKRLKFPESLKEIKGWAFYGCINLKNTITIPNNVTYIGRKAFADTDVTLSILSDRKRPVSVDEKDRLWLAKHTRLVNVTNEELLDEKLPKDLAMAYRSDPTRNQTPSQRRNIIINKATMPSYMRRATPIDYENADYETITVEQAMDRIKANKYDVDKIRAIYKNNYFEFEVRDNGKIYPLVTPSTRAWQLGTMDVDKFRHKVQSMKGLAEVLALMDKIYWTDEYDHIIRPESDIATKREANSKATGVRNVSILQDKNTYLQTLSPDSDVDGLDSVELDGGEKFSIPHARDLNVNVAQIDTGRHSWNSDNARSNFNIKVGGYANITNYQEAVALKQKLYLKYKNLVKALDNLSQHKSLYDEKDYQQQYEYLNDKKDTAFKLYKDAYDKYIKAEKYILNSLTKANKVLNNYLGQLYIKSCALAKIEAEQTEIIREAQDKLRQLTTVEIANEEEYEEQQEAVDDIQMAISTQKNIIKEYQENVEELMARIKELQDDIARHTTNVETLNIDLVREQQKLGDVAQKVINRISDEIDECNKTIDTSRKTLAKWGIQKYTPPVEKEIPQELDKMFSFGDDNKDEEEDN